MAGSARIASVEAPPDIARRRKIRFRIDRGADYGSDVAEREVLLVIEAREQRGPRNSDCRVLVASHADRDRRQIVVFEPRGVRNRSMARDALEFLRKLQMQLMRKRPWLLRRGRRSHQEQKGK